MSFLNTLKAEDYAVLEKYMLVKQFEPNTLILREGDAGDGCYLIDEGTIRLELTNVETDTDSVLGFLDAGMFLGEFSLLDGKPRSASAYAHTAVKARWLSSECFEEICKSYPIIGLQMTVALGQDLAAKLRNFDQKIAGYMFAHDIDRDTNEMVERAIMAQKSFEQWPEDRINALLEEIATTIAENAGEYADRNVKETGIGIAADKVHKIRFASLEVYRIIVDHLAAGVVSNNLQNKVTEIACPVGVIFGMIPVTNPVSTIVFKCLVALKGRNAIILSCHRNALGIGSQICDVIRDILERHGAPRDLVQTVRERSSRQKTMMFMHHPDVSLILATGGTSMVKAAYSSGTPAIGVGAGNAPVLICSDSDLTMAAQSIVKSKSFDNGVICGSENNLIVVNSIYHKFIEELKAAGAIILGPEEKERMNTIIFDVKNHSLNKSMVGKSAQYIADAAGIRFNKDTMLIIVPIDRHELDGHYGHEKLAPVLSLCAVKNEDEGIEVCKQILSNHGRGHTAVIYTKNQALIERYGCEIEASRILVNASASQGCVGIGTGLTPSFTLGCGTFGGNSTTDNITYSHLINIKRLAQAL
ncbi:aldehyde dehydrogenase family protein [Chloroflexota bacterium]